MIKKDKIFELRIDEEDELSGIDSISLVDEPAIEVNWIAFNKEKQENFTIPDGQDLTYSEMITSVGQSEEELFADGWKLISEDFISSNPNASSIEDTDEYLVRYKYVLNPEAPGAPIKETTREFCRDLLQKNFVYRVEDLEKIVNDLGSSALVWRGSYNCRHVWKQIRYHRDTKIINKGSVTRGRIDGEESYDVLGYPQPDTRTVNPSFSKDKFEKVSLDYDDTLETQRGKDLARRLINSGYDVYVVTKRQSSQNADVERIAKEVGIPKDRIYYTAGRMKWETIKRLGISRHYDNSQDEIDALRKYAPMIRAEKFIQEKFEEMSIFGFKPRYFHMCPGAIELFQHLISMEMDEETVGMVRSAAQIADNVFRIEEEVIKSELATPEQVMEAYLLIEDFKDVMHEIDELVGMTHDVSFMDGHLVKIKEYLKDDMGYDVGAIGGYVDPGVKKKKKDVISKSIAFETYNDYPEAAKNNACKVLKWRDEHGDEVKGMTRVGWTRANQLCSGENISESTIARMAAFARHRKNAEVAPEFKSTPWKDKGYVAWLGWGGTTGVEWASRKLESIRNNMSKQKFQIDNEEKRIVLGPAMIPGLKIFRKDALGNPYHVYFTEDTIRMIAEKYMKNKYTDNNDQMHNGQAVKDVYVIESWIKEDEQDKSNKYGYEDLPLGTWFVSMKVRNDDVWQRVKSGQLNGFSVSGFFEEVASFCREEAFLAQVAKILKNIKE